MALGRPATTSSREESEERLLVEAAQKNPQQLGILRGEGSWVLEDNHLMVRALEELGACVYKRYRLYQKDLV